MSTMEDTKEIEAWDTYTADGDMALDHHVIRSHRAPKVPRAFPIHRLVATFAAFAVAAGILNSGIATPGNAPANALSVPESIQWMEPPTRVTPQIDTGSQVDTAIRTANPKRVKENVPAVKKVILPPVPPVEKAIAYAMAQQGKPYRWAQAGPGGFDCSGLVLAAFRQIGIKLPHYTGTMISYGKKISRSQLQRGDIIFPTSGHVAIYLGNNMQIAASSGKHRVVVQPVYAFYAARRLV